MSERIGPRWLTWIILAYGLLEIPWVIYLIFFQQRTGTAQHTHLAALGLYGGGAVLALWAAWASWRQHRIVSVAAVMAATWLTAGVFFAVVLSAVHVVWAGVLGAVVAALMARGVLRERPVPAWFGAVLGFVAIVLLVNLVVIVSSDSTSIDADHLRILVVLYDSGEVAALLGLGWSLHRGAPRAATAFGSAGVVLFLLDAYVNVVVVPSGPAFTAALFYAIVGELPSIAMCAAGAALAMRRWQPLSRPVRTVPRASVPE